MAWFFRLAYFVVAAFAAFAALRAYGLFAPRGATCTLPAADLERVLLRPMTRRERRAAAYACTHPALVAALRDDVPALRDRGAARDVVTGVLAFLDAAAGAMRSPEALRRAAPVMQELRQRLAELAPPAITACLEAQVTVLERMHDEAIVGVPTADFDAAAPQNYADSRNVTAAAARAARTSAGAAGTPGTTT